MIPVYQLSSSSVVILGLMLLAAFGCGEGGPQRAAVTGQVSWEGKPVDSGTISFMTTGAAESASASAPIAAGKFSLTEQEGPAVGANRVEIIGMKNMGKKEAGRPHPPGTMVDDLQSIVPPEYNHASTLTAEIKEGENTLNFELPK